MLAEISIVWIMDVAEYLVWPSRNGRAKKRTADFKVFSFKGALKASLVILTIWLRSSRGSDCIRGERTHLELGLQLEPG